jgi:hypothetical protein
MEIIILLHSTNTGYKNKMFGNFLGWNRIRTDPEPNPDTDPTTLRINVCQDKQ